tara:strand:+ start:512 stop:895 length:384 start_codon:yes stop_codon:yes gene_type:complete
MAVQQLAKKQAKKEKKKQKDLDAKFAKDEEKAIERAGKHQEFMKGIYKQGVPPKLPKVKEKPSKQKPKTPKTEGIKIESLGPIIEAKDGGMMNKRLTKTVPPKKGPNSQGMRGTGSAIRGTKFKGVF